MAANSRFAVATHIMTLVAHDAPKGELLKSDIVAGSVNTNPVVVRRLMAELSKAGLLTCHQGKGGGVELARPAEKITLRDIYQAVGESDVFAFNPNRPNTRCPVSTSMAKLLTPVFSEVNDCVADQLKQTKLSDLVHKVD
ncbi:Rrf2 family transcriptional regulator [Bdellovibrio bacteriovorus]|uniref:Transcriptional regulator n=1 Tax=Bdellovibrio bacteriovorus TaxID=959 RepID=A0A1Z3N5E3_BDEBC|nr:Rrf2 family transcriptional regulator [Bdellovibrio bacteriovorus]ASD62688.1 transcriptional regulator [Bdellovibrio bacteriovorus]